MSTIANTQSYADCAAHHGLRRNLDLDTAFDNNNTTLGETKGKVPYSVKHSYRGRCTDADLTMLQKLESRCRSLLRLQHVAWFDGDADGIIWPLNTYRAFCTLNFCIFLSLLATFIIHGPFSYLTLPRSGRRLTDWIPDPRLPIYVANVHRANHGSDSEAYDRRGYLQGRKVEYGKSRDIINLFDFFGVFAYTIEFDGYCSKGGILIIYDGLVFPVLASRRHEKGAFTSKCST
ncbi:hypothetical protein K437DRAFT_278269 [Tilletiaria anomala UBC 951]|uniref:Uncharacterized protein n=1 Tax=Tilletiaria anomala (strain ATCC 24038 / CBS 436.72 / UBC 951) TaxID=1037660 RepID=A0A066VY23_TILAU|nr:uncharacterized protein K437DRAFT_278269 [Tilletiaria anomala UBC 951]KDN46642.1 hypothetical protein K437DRAFT_278269 [Tilletiaria anomala UBC 951]